jgi:hypothetical protein
MAILKDKKNGRTLTLNVVHGPGAGHNGHNLHSFYLLHFDTVLFVSFPISRAYCQLTHQLFHDVDVRFTICTIVAKSRQFCGQATLFWSKQNQTLRLAGKAGKIYIGKSGIGHISN